MSDSRTPEPPLRRGLPLWPFLLAAPLLLIAGILISLWLPELAERAAYRRLQSLPGVTVSRTKTSNRAWPWVPVNRYTDWLHRLRPPHPPLFHVQLRPDFPREEFVRVGALREIHNLDASNSMLVDSDLAILARGPKVRGLRLDNTAIGDTGVLSLHRAQLGLRYLSLKNTHVTDLAVVSLGEHTELEQLHLDGTAVEGRSLIALASLKKLTNLRLCRTLVNDAALGHVSYFPSLRSLDLYATRITDAGLPELARLPALVSLSLDRTSISEAGLSAYATRRGSRHLPNARLSLRHTRVTGPGLSRLPFDPRILCLSGTSVSDDLADWLASRTNLFELELDGTRFTEAGLDKLAASKSLQRVGVKGCPISEGAAIRFLTSSAHLYGATGRHRNWRPESTFVPGVGAVDILGHAEPGTAQTPIPPDIAQALWQFRGNGWLER